MRRIWRPRLALVAAVEADVAPEPSIINELQRELQSLAPALLQEAKALGATGEVAARLAAIGPQVARLAPESPLLEEGV